MKIQVIGDGQGFVAVYRAAPAGDYRERYNVELPAEQAERYLKAQDEFLKMQMELKSHGFTGLG